MQEELIASTPIFNEARWLIRQRAWAEKWTREENDFLQGLLNKREAAAPTGELERTKRRLRDEMAETLRLRQELENTKKRLRKTQELICNFQALVEETN